MRFDGAIFDMDGTLLDSMPVWRNLAPDFLKKHGIEPGPDFHIRASVPSIRGAVDFMISAFGLAADAAAETAEITARLAEFYRTEVRARPGARELLEALRRGGVRAGVLTATEPELAALALRSTGLAEYFPVGGVLSGAEHNLSKSTPRPFVMMRERLGTVPERTIVFEDALYAARTAARLGHPVAAVRDASEPRQNELAAVADWYCREWTEFPLEIFA